MYVCVCVYLCECVCVCVCMYVGVHVCVCVSSSLEQTVAKKNTDFEEADFPIFQKLSLRKDTGSRNQGIQESNIQESKMD